MSICSYNKNIRSNPPITPISANNKASKDDRPCSANPSRRSERRQTFLEHEKSHAHHRSGKDWKPKPPVNSKKNQGFVRFSSVETSIKKNDRVKNGAKKVSLNHLLNFKFEPRQQERDLPHSHSFKSKQYRHASLTATDCKDKFFRANSRYVVNVDHHSAIKTSDPDMLLPWEYVERVDFFVEDELLCPICLYPPTVGKITKCGHVYCWYCIQRYLSLVRNENRARDCPICGSDIRKNELRSISAIKSIPLKVGEELTMDLMCREKTSLTPTPSNAMSILESSAIPHYSNIQEYTADQILDNIVEPELEKLKLLLAAETGELEKRNFNSIIADCVARKDGLLEEIAKNEWKNSSLCTASSMVGTAATSTSDGDATSHENCCTYFFYQVKGNQNIFLDGLNTKCLLKEYLDYRNCPSSITAKVVHVDCLTMNQELRRRHKHLSHLPLSCEYKIVELKFLPPLVSQEVLDVFQASINKRFRNRKRKEKEENESRRRAEVKELRKMKEYFMGQSSDYNQHEFVMIPQNNIQPTSECDAVNLLDSNPSESVLLPAQVTCSVSFADKLKNGESLVKRLTSSTADIGTSFAKLSCDDDNDDDEVDPLYHAPAYQSSFNDALTKTLDGMLSVSSDAAIQTLNTNRKGGSKQKKKKATRLLFSNNAQMHP